MSHLGIDELIDRLAYTQVPPSVFNQYSPDSQANQIRCRNLRLYLNQMVILDSKLMLVGEAPGYQGAGQTGIPFTSERIMLDGKPELGLFGKEYGYRKTDEFPDRIWTEPTATMIWSVLSDVGYAPLLWNAFPFHPFRSGSPQSNRSPTHAEMSLGRTFLEQLFAIFDTHTAVAVGNKAHYALSRLGLSCSKVRHPSYGGKEEFRHEFLEIMAGEKVLEDRTG